MICCTSLCGGFAVACSRMLLQGLSPPLRGRMLFAKVLFEKQPACFCETRLLLQRCFVAMICCTSLCGGFAVACSRMLLQGLSPPLRGRMLFAKVLFEKQPACFCETRLLLQRCFVAMICCTSLCGGFAVACSRMLLQGLSPPLRGRMLFAKVLFEKQPACFCETRLLLQRCFVAMVCCTSMCGGCAVACSHVLLQAPPLSTLDLCPQPSTVTCCSSCAVMVSQPALQHHRHRSHFGSRCTLGCWRMRRPFAAFHRRSGQDIKPTQNLLKKEHPDTIPAVNSNGNSQTGIYRLLVS